MKIIGIAAIAASALCATTAFADPAAHKSAAGAMKLSQAECTSVWNQANPTGAAGVTEAQAAPYVANFKAANPDGDATIDQKEWLAACHKGLVNASSSTGSSSGAAGSGASGAGSSGGGTAQ